VPVRFQDVADKEQMYGCEKSGTVVIFFAFVSKVAADGCITILSRSAKRGCFRAHRGGCTGKLCVDRA
jgi:hypothetical protein